MPTLSEIPEKVSDVTVVQKDQEQINTASANVSRRGSADSVPLLNSDSCTEMRELRLMDQISTIST